jgi:hypothetical protein
MQPKLNNNNKKIKNKLKKREERSSIIINLLDGPTAIEKRQNELNCDYQILISLSQKRLKALEEAKTLFKFFDLCTDFELWSNITLQNLQEPLNQEHLDALEKKFKVNIFKKIYIYYFLILI